MEMVAFVIIGILTGLLSGLLGVGGGIIIVPALNFLFAQDHFPTHYLMQIITGTSLAAISITTLMTIWVQNRRKIIDWKMLQWMIPILMIGAVLGVLLARFLPTLFLQNTFAIFCLVLGLRFLLMKKITTKQAHSSTPLIIKVASLFIGMMSGLLGIGGGLMLIPLLLWSGKTMSQSGATSVACTFPIALSGTASAMVVGHNLNLALPYTVGFVYWPAALVLGITSLASVPLGVYLSHYLPSDKIKRFFGFILLVVAWRMLQFQW